MKVFVLMIALFTTLVAQASTISAKALLGIDSRIEVQRLEMESKVNEAEITDIVEGKIVAAMIGRIESIHADVEIALSNIASDEDLTVEAVAAIHELLDQSEALINEI